MRKTNTAMFYIGGCSGSGSPEFTRSEFGNLTTSFGILSGKRGIFVDNGSGVAKVSSFFIEHKVKEVYGLQTHFHGDHRQGIHTNRLLFVPNLVRGIYAPQLSSMTFRRLFEIDFSQETWPVCPNEMSITHFKPGVTLSTPFSTKTLCQNHPGGSIAYRVTTEEGDVVIATDGEPTGKHAKRMADFISGSSLLYVDCQYRKGEYDGNLDICGSPAMSRAGWGHGTPEMLFDVLMKCKKVPKKIIIGHHDPARTTGDLYVFEQEIRNHLVAFPSVVRLAREGDMVEI